MALGGFYIAVMAAYILFEIFAVNYRPVLIGGVLEASYPSSTTLLVLCVMPTAAMQMKERLKNAVIKKYFVLAIYIFTAFMVAGRIVSGAANTLTQENIRTNKVTNNIFFFIFNASNPILYSYYTA